MSDFTAESAKPIEAADNSLKKATTNEAAKEALSGLATSNDPAQRAKEVSQATNVLVNNGDLPQVLLVFDGSENLSKLGWEDDRIDKNNPTEMGILKSAAETGTFVDKEGNVVTLTTDEWIAARALYQNFDAVEGTAGVDAGDSVVSIADINHAATDSTAQAALGTRYAELESAVMAFPGNPDGSENPEAFKQIFGKETVTKDDIATLISGPKFDALTPQQQRGVLALYSQYDSIAGKDGDASSVNQHDLWMAAGEAGINYGGNKDAMTEAQADVDSYNSALEPKPPVDGNIVDSIVRDLEKPLPSGTNVFDYLDGTDNTMDGTITREQVHTLATSGNLGLIDPKLAASITALDQNWDQLSGGKDSVSILDLAAQSNSYKGDATTDAIKAHAAQAAAPLTPDEINAAMRAIYQPNPGSDSAVFYLLTDGQEGRPEDRKGFTREDIDRTIQAYSSVYGPNSPEFLAAQASLGKVRADFDKYDSDGNGSISYQELATISGNAANIGQLQEAYAPADPDQLAGLLEAGGNFDHLISQKDLTTEDLTKAIAKAPEGSPERATLEYVLAHYDQLKTIDGDDKHLTWNDVEIFAATGPDYVPNAQATGDEAADGTDDTADSSSAGADKPKEVPIGTGTGVVNADGTITYTVGRWTNSNNETLTTLENTVMELWGLDPDNATDRANTLAALQAANPNANLSEEGNYQEGTVLTIPGEYPGSEDQS